jgi:predicted  nucleic acid-binding Zn-ribbon protein
MFRRRDPTEDPHWIERRLDGLYAAADAGAVERRALQADYARRRQRVEFLAMLDAVMDRAFWAAAETANRQEIKAALIEVGAQISVLDDELDAIGERLDALDDEIGPLNREIERLEWEAAA